jgi:dTMP kinase
MKGTIISIEGTDGAGKHTQQQLLAKTLKEQGYNVFEQSFPHYDSDSSAPVKMYLGGEFGATANCLDAYQASTLYAVDRMCTYKKTIEPHYENGEIILFDRYVQSNFIHQCSKIEDESDKNTNF